MKEYLNPEQGYFLVKCFVGKTPVPESWIEVPNGAEKLTSDESKTLTFWDDGGESFNVGQDIEWRDESEEGILSWEQYSKYKHTTLWQRESINDKIATAEVARQEEKHSHYKKYVSHLNVIDVYRILELYGVESHAVGHAIKKLLCGGQRGAKGRKQDIQEAIDSLNRELEMVAEDEL